MTTPEYQFAPYSQESEEALLGSVLVNPECFADVADIVSGEDFYILRHRYIWEALARISERNDQIDYVTVQDELRAIKHLDDIGGAAYLLHLVNSTPTSTRATTYAALVARAAERRRWLALADEIKALAMDEESSIEQVRAGIAQRYDGVERNSRTDDPAPIRDSISRYFELVEATEGLGDAVSGLPTGFRAYDELLDGLQDGSLNLIAGRPGMGKSALALCIALNVARDQRRRAALGEPQRGIYIWSGEMPERQLNERLMSIETGVPNRKLRRGLRPNTGMTRAEWTQFVKGAGALGQHAIFLDDSPGMTPARLISRARRLHRHTPGGLQLIIVDYIGLMEAGFKKENREKELSYISRQLKIAAGAVCPVICLSQLNRSLENRADKRPQLSDLRDSGALEQDADTVTFIYRDVVYNEATEFPNTAELILAKNRHGDVGMVITHFDRQITRFSDAAVRHFNISSLTGEIIED